MIKMKHLRERGEIATILTLGVLVVIGVSAMVSSLFLNQKKTTGSQAAVSCDDPKWKCGPECASQEVRNVYSQNSDKWREEAGKIYGGCDKENKPIPPTPSCPGKYDKGGACNPACCESDGQCSGQKCNIPNGYCLSGKSCNPNKEAKFHTTCVGGACVNQACPDTGTCVDDCSSCSGGSTTTTSSGGGTTGTAPATDCTPGGGGFNGGTYYCCYPANGGKKGTKWPHYEPEGKEKVDCAEKTGIGQATGKETLPSVCGSNSVYYGAVCNNQCIEIKEGNWSCKDGWCCEPKRNSTPLNCEKVDCGPSTGLSYWLRKDGSNKLLGYYKEDYLCKDSRILDSGIGSLETVKREKCGGTSTPGDCMDKDYTIHIDSGACGGDDKLGKPNQKKYKKDSANTCNGPNEKYINDPNCECSSVQCDSSKTGVYQKGNGYYYNRTCDGLPVTQSKAIACTIGTVAEKGSYTVWYSRPIFPLSFTSKVTFSITMSQIGGGYLRTARWDNPVLSLVDGYYTFTDLPVGNYNITLTPLGECPDRYEGSTATATINESGDNGRNTLSWTKSACTNDSPITVNTSTSPVIPVSNAYPDTWEKKDELCSKQHGTGSYCGTAVGGCSKTELGYTYEKDFKSACSNSGTFNQVNGYCCVKKKIEIPKEVWLNIKNNCNLAGGKVDFVVYWFAPGMSGWNIPINKPLKVGETTSVDITNGKTIACKSWGLLGISQPGHLSFTPLVVNSIDCNATTNNVFEVSGGQNCPY